MSNPNGPKYRAFICKEGKEGKNFYTEVGVAWAFKEKDGLFQSSLTLYQWTENWFSSRRKRKKNHSDSLTIKRDFDLVASNTFF